MNYIFSYFYKGWSLEELHRYDEAIETYTTGKKALDNYKNESFYQDYIDLFNEDLSRCYNELTKH